MEVNYDFERPEDVGPPILCFAMIFADQISCNKLNVKRSSF